MVNLSAIAASLGMQSLKCTPASGVGMSTKPSNFRRRVRLGIEGFVVRRPAIQPHEDAVYIAAWSQRPLDRASRLVSSTPQPQQIAEPQPQHAPQTELEKIPAADAGAVGLEGIHENSVIKYKLRRVLATPKAWSLNGVNRVISAPLPFTQAVIGGIGMSQPVTLSQGPGIINF